MSATYIDYINDEIEKLIASIKEETEKTLAEMVQNYDFIVGSMELKIKLESMLPPGANIAYSPFVEDTTKVFVIKKIDVNDIWEDGGII